MHLTFSKIIFLTVFVKLVQNNKIALCVNVWRGTYLKGTCVSSFLTPDTFLLSSNYIDSTGFLNLTVGVCTYKILTFILHTEIKWFENVSPWIVFDREKEILVEEKKGVIPCEEQRENMQQTFGKPTFLWGKKTTKPLLCIYHVLCFYHKKVTAKNLLIFVLVESQCAS